MLPSPSPEAVAEPSGAEQAPPSSKAVKSEEATKEVEIRDKALSL